MQEEFFYPGVTKRKCFWYTFWWCFCAKRIWHTHNHENRTVFYIAHFSDSRVDPTGFHSKQRTEIPQHR